MKLNDTNDDLAATTATMSPIQLAGKSKAGAALRKAAQEAIAAGSAKKAREEAEQK